jgi:Tfp pilus assembly protein PilN
MSQHPLDLLPDSIRAQSEAGVRMGRYISAFVITVLVVVALTTHARLSLQGARAQLRTAEADADLVLAAEHKIQTLQEQLNDLKAELDLYSRVALPLPISRVVATIVNELPDSVALDRIDLDAQTRRAGQGPRTRTAEQTEQQLPRILVGELGGFAASDQDITELVKRLEGTTPFRDVNLDYSRSRLVRDQSAREFRVSFRIDLDAHYELSDAGGGAKPAPTAQPGGAS